MPTAYVHLPPTVHYRREAFTKGFARLGYTVKQETPTTSVNEDDVTIVWNMSARSRMAITNTKAGGGALLVAENGYLGKDSNGHQFYAIALDGHNGSGRWYAPDDSRLKRLEVDFKPFRNIRSPKVVIAGQRGIGSPAMRSPPRFAESTQAVLKRAGFYAHIRPHPGQHPPETALMDDLKEAWALVVWSSNCATQALLNGIATYYCAPTIVSAPGAKPFRPNLDRVFDEESRYQAFANMAWAQWSLAEISSGEALRTLIEVKEGKLPSIGLGLDQ